MPVKGAAFVWLALAASSVHALAAELPADPATAAFQRGLALDLGHGSHPDPVGAFNAYLLAAQLGLPAAEFNVAVMYDSGRGVAPDPSKAARWYQAAAAGGLLRAAYNLGQIYEQGDGVRRDPDTARAWFALAARQGVSAARPRVRDRALRASAIPAANAGDAATPLAPADGEVVAATVRPFPFVWLPPASGGRLAYVVQVTMQDHPAGGFVFTGDTDVTAIASNTSLPQGRYAWRVFAVQGKTGRVTTSGWTRFVVSMLDR